MFSVSLPAVQVSQRRTSEHMPRLHRLSERERESRSPTIAASMITFIIIIIIYIYIYIIPYRPLKPYSNYYDPFHYTLRIEP